MSSNYCSKYSDHLEEKWRRLETIGKQTPGVIKEFNPLENIPGGYHSSFSKESY